MSNFIKKTNELIAEIREIISETFEFLMDPFYVFWDEADFPHGPYDHNFRKFDANNCLKFENKSPDGETVREGYVYPENWGDATIIYLPSFVLEKKNKLGVHFLKSLKTDWTLKIDDQEIENWILKIDENLESAYSDELKILSQKFDELSRCCVETLYYELLKTDYQYIETITETAVRHDLLWLGQADGFKSDRFILLLLQALGEQHRTSGGLGAFDLDEVFAYLKKLSFSREPISEISLNTAWRKFLSKNKLTFDVDGENTIFESYIEIVKFLVEII